MWKYGEILIKLTQIALPYQKTAIRIVNKVESHSTNLLFVNSQALNIMDLVALKTLQIMYRAHCGTLPDCIQRFYSEKESTFSLRGNFIFERKWARTNVKSRCVSVYLVKL